MSGLVDWSLAGRIAALVAGEEPGMRPSGDLDRAVSESVAAVEGYTGLEPIEEVPEPEWVTRRQWAEINLGSMRDSLGAIETELAGRLELPGAARGLTAATLGRLAAVQVGALVGYGSRRVLGQYEFSLLAPTRRDARLLFVAANIGEAQRGFDADPETVLRWIALHEVTHAVHFGATPWLRVHLSDLAGRLLRESTLGLQPSELLAAARSMLATDPRELLRRIGDSDPLTLLTPPQSRHLLASVQASMASVEGYAEHVMDAAAPLIGEQIGALRVQMERRRSERSPLARLLAWLLGMELKLRQYRDGKRFADAVVEAGGIAILNRAWLGPEQLPTLEELSRATAWIERTRSAPATA